MNVRRPRGQVPSSRRQGSTEAEWAPGKRSRGDEGKKGGQERWPPARRATLTNIHAVLEAGVPIAALRYNLISDSVVTEQLADLRGDVAFAHERFTYEHGVRAAAREPLRIRAGVNAALGDQQN